MTGRFPDSLRGKSRLNSLMLNSFSRLHESSLNHTSDSGYQSSFASLSTNSTPSLDVSESSSHVYCSTPVTEDSALTIRNSVLGPVLETPVLSGRTRFSADRIPCQRTLLPLGEESGDVSTDVLSCLIRNRIRPAIRSIYSHLTEEDLLRLCQVSNDYCLSVCDDKPALRRLSKFLIVVHQNGENRTTLSQNNIRPHAGVLRPIHNVLSTSLPVGTMWSIPSPLETVDMNSIPRQLKLLITMTKTLSENSCVTTCHKCRRLVEARLNHQKEVLCPGCSKPSRRTNTNSRLVNKTKASLFSSFR